MSHKANKEHILPLNLYLKVGGALLLLTILTVWVAQFHLGAANLFVAMLIAGVKASLVVLFFMHLKYDNKLFAAVFIGALLFLAAFISLTMADTMTRGDIDEIKARAFDNQVQYAQPAHGAEHGGAADSAVAHDSLSTGDSVSAHSQESSDTSH